MASTNVQAFSGDVEISGNLNITGDVVATTGVDKVNLTEDSSNTNFRIPFAGGTTGAQPLKTDAGLLYNPSTNILTATSFTGNISGRANHAQDADYATSAGNANHAQDADSATYANQTSKLYTGEVNAHNANYYVPFRSGHGADYGNYYNDQDFYYNPYTNYLNCNASHANRAGNANGRANHAQDADYAGYAGNAGYANHAQDADFANYTRYASSGMNIWGSQYDGNNGGLQVTGRRIPNINVCGNFDHGDVRAQGFQAWSDRRIKEEIEDISDDSALQKIREISPKIYGYRDKANKGTDRVYGFIAQEVKEVLPYAVSVGPGHIPDILTIANCSVLDSNVSILHLSNALSSNNLVSNQNVLRIESNAAISFDVDVISMDDLSTIRVKSHESLVESDSYMVKGRHIDDFHNLKKDIIFTVTTAAVQEIDRLLTTEKAKVALLEQQVADLIIRVTALENA